MINLNYLKNSLLPLGYQLDEKGELPIFYNRVLHKNPNSIYAFTLIIVTLDKYTVTIEGLNEMLIHRAIKAKAIEVNSYEELDALREIIYDNTHEEVKQFNIMVNFFETQMKEVYAHPIKSDEHQKALANIQLMIEAAKATY